MLGRLCGRRCLPLVHGLSNNYLLASQLFARCLHARCSVWLVRCLCHDPIDGLYRSSRMVSAVSSCQRSRSVPAPRVVSCTVTAPANVLSARSAARESTRREAAAGAPTRVGHVGGGGVGDGGVVGGGGVRVGGRVRGVSCRHRRRRSRRFVMTRGGGSHRIESQGSARRPLRAHRHAAGISHEIACLAIIIRAVQDSVKEIRCQKCSSDRIPTCRVLVECGFLRRLRPECRVVYVSAGACLSA